MRKLDTKEVATHLAQFGRTMLARAEPRKFEAFLRSPKAKKASALMIKQLRVGFGWLRQVEVHH